DRKFLFMWVSGGWDPTKVFMTSNEVDRAEGDTVASYGGRQFVSNPDRPSVDQFWAQNHQEVSVLDGMLIRSINHPICRNLWMTNTPNAGRPDWPATIAHAAADRYSVPHLIINGYNMAGEYSAFTAVSGRGGQLQALNSGLANFTTDSPYTPPPMDVQALMDQFAANRATERSAAAVTDIEKHLTNSYREAANRLIEFKQDTVDIDLNAGGTISGQISLATKILSGGISRCVTLSHGGGSWDTHVDNSEQSALFASLFGDLMTLKLALENTPGEHAATLAEETVVMVFSEMGRTPFLNSTGGKDHWMYSSAMLWGPGVRGGISLGGYDPYLNGRPIDLNTGLPDDDGIPMTPDVLGSTLMTLADIDPRDELDSDTSLSALLA
ncbi:MAG: DUF1501 domain-containing protein, partial [Myxococcales bacterium]|nr:DUF1501 domain-containing protein [Myxococcales bacterium]